jgi:hypothetical protein
VPKVACFEVAGVNLRFYSNDHEPPHFHAVKPGEWEVRVFFTKPPGEMISIEYSKKKNRPTKKDLAEIVKKTQEHQFELYEQWQATVNVTPLPER